MVSEASPFFAEVSCSKGGKNAGINSQSCGATGFNSSVRSSRFCQTSRFCRKGDGVISINLALPVHHNLADCARGSNRGFSLQAIKHCTAALPTHPADKTTDNPVRGWRWTELAAGRKRIKDIRTRHLFWQNSRNCSLMAYQSIDPDSRLILSRPKGVLSRWYGRTAVVERDVLLSHIDQAFLAQEV